MRLRIGATRAEPAHMQRTPLGALPGSKATSLVNVTVYQRRIEMLWLTLICAVLVMGAAIMAVEAFFGWLTKATRNLFGV